MARSSTIGICALVGAACLAANVAALAAPDDGVTAYRTYASAQARMLSRMAKILAKDVGNGDLQAAQNDYAATHRYLERIRPLLTPGAELTRSLDAEADEFPGKAADPSFAGFHRVEQALYALQTTRGLTVVADRLHGDTRRLEDEVATRPIQPARLVDAPAALIDQVSARVLDGGREPYAGTDLWDIEANVDGAEAIVAALRPQVAARDPLAMARVDAAFAATRERLAQFRDGCGFKSYDMLTRADRAALRQTTSALARELGRLKSGTTID